MAPTWQTPGAMWCCHAGTGRNLRDCAQRYTVCFSHVRGSRIPLDFWHGRGRKQSMKDPKNTVDQRHLKATYGEEGIWIKRVNSLCPWKLTCSQQISGKANRCCQVEIMDLCKLKPHGILLFGFLWIFSLMNELN